MASSASSAPRYARSYHLILRSSAVLEVLPRRVGAAKTLPIAAGGGGLLPEADRVLGVEQ